MPHGQPDFGLYTAKATVYGLADNAELAARLGSIDTFDRSGDVIFLDGFEYTIKKFVTSTTGLNGSVVQTAETARNGGLSLKMTTGDVAGDNAQMGMQLPYPVLSRIGFELAFTAKTELKWYLFEIYLYDGAARIEGVITYDISNFRLQYQDSDGNNVTFATNVNLAQSPQLFHIAKLVVDFTTNEYVHFILDNTIYPLDGIACREVTPDVTNPYLYCQYKVFALALGGSYGYADDLIITQNET